MAFLYILYSEKLNQYYVGSTPNLDLRLIEHEKGLTPSTKSGRPWVCLFSYQTETLTEARRLEYRVKRWKNRNLIERIVQDQKILIR